MKKLKALLGAGVAGAVAASLLLSPHSQTSALADTPASKAAATTAAAEPEAPQIDPSADRIFKAACKYIADAKAFSVKSEEWQDLVLPNGQKIQVTRAVTIEEKRPDRLHVEVVSPRHSHGLWYQNKALTILDRASGFYGTVEAPESIDKTIDSIEDHFGIEIPLADVLVADPYASAMANVKSAVDLGKVNVLGVACRHLAFTSERVDWQIWIQEGAKPLPRKIVLNYKTETGSPNFTAIFSDWDLTSAISDEVFNFAPPENAFKVDVKALEQAAAPAETQKK